MDNFSDHLLLHRSPQVLSCDLQAGTVLLDVDQGLYFSLDSVAAQVWQLLEKERSFAELVSGIFAEFDGELEAIRADLNLFLKEMLDNRLLRIT